MNGDYVMFIVLTEELKGYLKDIVKNHPDGEEFTPTDTEEKMIQSLQNAGYLASFRLDVIGDYTAKYDYKDTNYDFLEQEHRRSSAGNTYNYNNCNNFGVGGDSSTVNVNVNSGIPSEQLNCIIEQIQSNSSPEITEEVNDLLELILDELKKQSPKKNILKTGLDALKALKGSVEFASAVTSLVTFLSTYIIR